MSYSTVLGVTPDRRPTTLAEFHNGHGWSPSIWRRLLAANGLNEHWMSMSDGFGDLDRLWRDIESLPDWQKAPLVLTFDTGVIPWQEFGWAATQLAEFDRRLPAPEGHVNHVPAMVELLRSGPEAPFIGVWGTSVSENPFDPWDSEKDEPGSGIPLGGMYLLGRHHHLVPGYIEALKNHGGADHDE